MVRRTTIQSCSEPAERRTAFDNFCCGYHAHFLDNDDDERLQKIVHQPMSEGAAAGIEAARKPSDPSAYKGYERREAGQRDFGFTSGVAAIRKR